MVHLIIIQNGFTGDHKRMHNMKTYLKEKLIPSEDYHIEICDLNDLSKTWHGIAESGKRLLSFVEKQTGKYQPAKISFIGHSFGSIIIRYCIGLLHEKDYFVKVKPDFFVSIASPNLGLKSLPSVGEYIARWLIVTGQELLLQDKILILFKMTDLESNFVKGLSLFSHRLVYGNICNDSLVNLATSVIAIDQKFSLPDLIEKNQLVPINVSPISISIEDPSTTTSSTVFSQINQLMYQNLSHLTWIRQGIDLSDFKDPHSAIAFKGTQASTVVLDDIIKRFLEPPPEIASPVIVPKLWSIAGLKGVYQHFVRKYFLQVPLMNKFI